MATKRRPASLTDLAAGRRWGIKSPRWGFACPLPGPLV
jgi:hypothetical protein